MIIKDSVVYVASSFPTQFKCGKRDCFRSPLFHQVYVGSKLQRIERREQIASSLCSAPTKIMIHNLRFNFESDFSCASCISLGWVSLRLVFSYSSKFSPLDFCGF